MNIRILAQSPTLVPSSPAIRLPVIVLADGGDGVADVAGSFASVQSSVLASCVTRKTSSLVLGALACWTDRVRTVPKPFPNRSQTVAKPVPNPQASHVPFVHPLRELMTLRPNDRKSPQTRYKPYLVGSLLTSADGST